MELVQSGGPWTPGPFFVLMITRYKDLRDLCEGNSVLIEVKVFHGWTFVVHINSLGCLKQISLVQRLPSSGKKHSQRRKR